MLEALNEIKAAEEQLAIKKQAMLDNIQKYATERNQELQKLQTENHQLLTKLMAEREAAEAEQLAAEKELLLIEAKKVSDDLQEQYQKHDQAAIQTIIERVKQNYGSD
ncbi:hypothetical protein [Enterococcus sp. LJL120]